ncbi:MAG: 3-oxoacyl-[acyl-carrier-protein] reductase [Clostridiales bacterium]|jgi:3-oxoacyl-(acyl-carrier-protein) reductase|uniref:3-oxoacyl-[acyl-carrier-protein] reductase n=1 Tax=Bovifimicola ammoniilytica TaxID=2981720 RepID=UPI0003381439|nr:3-oxoacyl-[acyl-carrier-protein] reductase [Bovifimicola ammoniilytica]MBD8941398.1 3-oxoacyl-[acyl-carrier-protein] reductase [Clostridiales bacterium]MCU6753944.1 3-oxoacyl-[acyl-carrier-protein] reductase [Bovifimicola ammoniilytica]CCZ04503.1 3-oxoacyl-[acyl-carrier-protein] reductase [Eubacterium sp. CAG:603]SCJ76787.1 3-oxoacyl-[acyl-carrier-protein] reductase FabG [uncultured Eubacterium sp.]
MLLENKTAIVTGSAKGIGKGIATEFAKQGATVVINYCGSKEAALKTVEEIKAFGGKAIPYQADISDYEMSKKMMDDIIKEYGAIDILVNNAGITRDNLILRMSESEFDDVIRTNLKGTFNCIKHVTKYMLKNKSGKIINISSISGVNGIAGQANYSASKAGIIGLTKSFAKEMSSKGININAIAPGFIETDMTKVLNDKYVEEIVNTIPSKRVGRPEDIAKAALFLASDMSDYITGQTLMVDGGLGL